MLDKLEKKEKKKQLQYAYSNLSSNSYHMNMHKVEKSSESTGENCGWWDTIQHRGELWSVGYNPAQGRTAFLKFL